MEQLEAFKRSVSDMEEQVSLITAKSSAELREKVSTLRLPCCPSLCSDDHSGPCFWCQLTGCRQNRPTLSSPLSSFSLFFVFAIVYVSSFRRLTPPRWIFFWPTASIVCSGVGLSVTAGSVLTLLVYLSSKGVNPTNHPVKKELDRIKDYMKRIKRAENDGKDEGWLTVQIYSIFDNE